ncbi:MAG: hypothetical protein WAN36_15995, partial [Calditrichia bacterium]
MPQPGSGCISQDPLFVNPASFQFGIQSGSPCYQSGAGGYDIGAKFVNPIPEAPGWVELQEGQNGSQMIIRWRGPERTVHGTPLDSLSKVCIWRNDSLLTEISNPSVTDTMMFSDAVSQPDYYQYKICAANLQGQEGRVLFTNYHWTGGDIRGAVILDMDNSQVTGAALKTTLQQIGYGKQIYLTDNTGSYPLESTLDAVFVCLGVYPNGHQLSEAEGLLLKNYLDDGGN